MNICKYDPTNDNADELTIAKLFREIEELCKTSTAKFLFYDEKIAELCLFIKENLKGSLQSLLNDLDYSGELDKIITESVLKQFEWQKFELHDLRTITDEIKNKISYFTNPQIFGAMGDGVIDDSKAIQSTFESVTNGGVIEFPITDKLYKLSSPISVKGKNIIIRNGRFDCEGLSSVFNINDNSSFITFENCYFYKGNQIIRIFKADNLTIKNCVFEETGYCIIQSHNSTSNNVNVLNNRCINIVNDFVECNCAKNAPSYNWIISGNIYTHKEIPTTESIEKRFIGVTAVENVVISNNIVEHVKGDACVHLEDIGGKVIIEGNIFKDCMGTGYIYILHEKHNTIINGNHFINTLRYNTETKFIYVWTGENTYADVIITNNMFVGNNQSYPFTVGYNTIFNGNKFKGFDIFLPKTCRNIKFFNNYIEANRFCYIDKDVMNAWIENASFKNNVIKGDIHLLHNNTGSQFTKNVIFEGNEILSNVLIKDCKNLFFTNNTIANGKSFTFNTTSYYSENMKATNNFIFGVGMAQEYK